MSLGHYILLVVDANVGGHVEVYVSFEGITRVYTIGVGEYLVGSIGVGRQPMSTGWIGGFFETGIGPVTYSFEKGFGSWSILELVQQGVTFLNITLI